MSVYFGPNNYCVTSFHVNISTRKGDELVTLFQITCDTTLHDKSLKTSSVSAEK